MREGNTGTCGDEGHCEGTKGSVLFTEERWRVKNEEGMRKGETVIKGEEPDDRRNGGEANVVAKMRKNENVPEGYGWEKYTIAGIRAE